MVKYLLKEGNGGFDAFVCALTIILKNLEIKLPTLIDYKVHIPKGGQTNALTEVVLPGSLRMIKKQLQLAVCMQIRFLLPLRLR